MQTILGSGGAIGIELAKSLKQFTSDIRLVSRNPRKVNQTDQLLPANLLDQNDVMKAVKGSEIVYVTVGFEYKLKVWQENWPVLINNVIEACKVENAKLVFFDNIYMYDKDYLNGMTEDTPINPPSKKGKVRAEIVNKIMLEVKSGRLTALIARSADFYGPGIKDRSMLVELAFKPLSAGKAANCLASKKFKHSYTYTVDAAKATALLGNTPSAYGNVWHLPTAPNPYTSGEWIEQIAKAFGVKPKAQVLPIWMVKITGLFVPVMKEIPEMMYQYDRDYVFDSSKFEKEFNFKPTSYDEGIKNIIKIDYSSKI